MLIETIRKQMRIQYCKMYTKCVLRWPACNTHAKKRYGLLKIQNTYSIASWSFNTSANHVQKIRDDWL